MNQVFIDIYNVIWKQIFTKSPILELDKFINLYTIYLPLTTKQTCEKTSSSIFSGKEYNYKRFLSQEALIDMEEKNGKLKPKENIKSLEELLAKINDIALFRGSRTINSEVVEESDDIHSSNYIYRSIHSYSCQKMLFDYNNRTCEYLMASSGNVNCSFGIRLRDCANINNSFDVHWSSKSSNCYFCANVSDLRDCLFCFNIYSAQYCIGNMQFEKEEYFKLKDIILNEYFQQLNQPQAFVSLESL